MMDFSPNLGSGVLAEGVVQMFRQPSFSYSGLGIVSASYTAVDRVTVGASLECTCSFSRTFSDSQSANAMPAHEGLSPHSVGDLA